jgi:hypothetical protein
MSVHTSQAQNHLFPLSVNRHAGTTQVEAALKKVTSKRGTAKKPKASKKGRAAQRRECEEGSVTSSPSDKSPGNRPYFAWLAHYREKTGADLPAARQAYQSLSDQDKTVWKEQWATNGQAVSS